MLSCLCLYPRDYFHLRPALLLWAWAVGGQSKSTSLPCRCWSVRSYWGTSLHSPAQPGLSQWPHSRCSEGSRKAWRAEWCQWAGCPPGTWKSSDKNGWVSQFSFLPLTGSQNMQVTQKVPLEKHISTKPSNNNNSSNRSYTLFDEYYAPRVFPWWLSGKESAGQCKRCRFYPQVRKISWRRKWQPILLFLPGKSLGQRSLVGYRPWIQKEPDMTERVNTTTCQALS